MAPLDEALAARGLAPKLFMWQTPDVWSQVQGWDAVAAKAAQEPLNVQVRVMVRAMVVLRGIRGASGTAWVPLHS